MLVQPWLSHPLQSWKILATTEDIQLLLFQLLYAFYILELGGYTVSIIPNINLYVRELENPANTLLYFEGNVFFKAKFRNMLYICHVFKTETSNLGFFVNEYLKGLFPKENFESTTSTNQLVLQVALALQKENRLQVQQTGGLDVTRFLQTPSMPQNNISNAYFMPQAPTVAKNEVIYRQLLQKQKEVQTELLKYRK